MWLAAAQRAAPGVWQLCVWACDAEPSASSGRVALGASFHEQQNTVHTATQQGNSRAVRDMVS